MRTHVTRNATLAVIEPREQDGDMRYKPKGFWYEVDADWRRWCEGEQPGWITDSYLYEVTLGAENVLQITSVKELDAFHREYGVSDLVGLEGSFERMFRRPDWERLARDYDGLEIAPYQWTRRLNGPTWYYGWDCASGVIWRPRGMTVTLLGECPRVQEEATA